MPKRTTHINKKEFKLPFGITKEKVKDVYSTSTDIVLEGYMGKIFSVSSRSSIPEEKVFECRPAKNHGGKAWISIAS